MMSRVLAGCLAALVALGCDRDRTPDPAGADATVDAAVDAVTASDLAEGVPDADAAPEDEDSGPDVPSGPPVIEVAVGEDLQAVIDAAADGATLQLAAGTWTATPADWADPGCGNCSDADFANGAAATRGFLVEGKALHLVGASREETVLVTGAGYGLLFVGAGESSVRSLTVTGGKRDADGMATDAGIVVMTTTLEVEDVSVSGNDDLYTGPEPDPVVGVGGIFGREGSDLTIRDSIIENNSWDGVTLYRGVPGEPDTGPVARVQGCRIGCTVDCVGTTGRGVGIASTWDSQITAVGNVVHHYWKGIGSFGESLANVHNNVVRDQVGWGVIASGESTMFATNNVIVRNGTTALSAWNLGTSGAFVNNIVVGNGTSPDEWVGKKTGVWFNADLDDFRFEYNLVFDNADFDVCMGGTPDDAPCIELPLLQVGGNLSVDPGFAGDESFHLIIGSPAIDAGDPEIEDTDGTRSDMGVYGGPLAPGLLP